MKKTIVIALTLLLLIGCRHNRALSPRLVELDSLIAVTPDSTVALLEAIPADSLRNPENRAYHALLLTQAKYKANIHAYRMDTINLAVRHYSGGQDEEKQTRSILYKGSVMEELPQLDSAMFYYKYAEDLAARSGDTYHRAYALMRQASLYQNSYAKKEAIYCYRKAIEQFKKTSNGYHLMYCYQELGNLYLTISPDSALFFIKEAIRMKSYGDVSDYAYSLTALASYYYIKKDYHSSIYYSTQVIGMDTDRYTKFLSCHRIAQSYSILGRRDSCEYYFNIAPSPQSKSDSVLFLQTIASLSDDSLAWIHASYNVADSLLNIDQIIKLQSVGSRYDEARKHLRTLSNNRIAIVVLVLIAMTCALTGLGVYWRKRHQLRNKEQLVDANKRRIAEIEELARSQETIIKKNEEQINHADKQINELKKQIEIRDRLLEDSSKRLSELHKMYMILDQTKVNALSKGDEIEELNHQIATQTQHILVIVENMTKNAKAFYESVHKDCKISEFQSRIKTYINSDFILKLVELLNAAYPHLSRNLQREDITSVERTIAYLHFAGFSNRMIAEYMNLQPHTVTNYKGKLAKRLLGSRASIQQLLHKSLGGHLD